MDKSTDMGRADFYLFVHIWWLYPGPNVSGRVLLYLNLVSIFINTVVTRGAPFVVREVNVLLTWLSTVVHGQLKSELKEMLQWACYFYCQLIQKNISDNQWTISVDNYSTLLLNRKLLLCTLCHLSLSLIWLYWMQHNLEYTFHLPLL